MNFDIFLAIHNVNKRILCCFSFQCLTKLVFNHYVPKKYDITFISHFYSFIDLQSTKKNIV